MSSDAEVGEAWIARRCRDVSIQRRLALSLAPVTSSRVSCTDSQAMMPWSSACLLWFVVVEVESSSLGRSRQLDSDKLRYVTSSVVISEHQGFPGPAATAANASWGSVPYPFHAPPAYPGEDLRATRILLVIDAVIRHFPADICTERTGQTLILAVLCI